MRLVRLFASAALLAFGSVAHAQDHYGTPGSWMWTQGAWYGGAGFRAGSFKVPGFASGTTAFGDTERLFGHTFSRLTSYGATGHFGYALTDGTLPLWLGRNVRLQIFGGYNDGQAVTSVAPGPVATNFSSVSVDGQQVATDTDTATITSTARVHQRDWQAGFRFATDYEFGQGTFIVTPTFDVMHKFPHDYKVIFVGDASMSPYEIAMPGGSVEHMNEEPGQTWMQRITRTYPACVWLNPVPEREWDYTQSIRMMRQLVSNRMYPLTLEGLDRAMRELVR